METLKWVLSAAIAMTVALVGMGLAIGAVVFALFLKILGIFGFITAALAIMVKEKIDERDVK